jgi:hypothetical protein
MLGIATVRGCTISSVPLAPFASLRSNPTGSARTVRTGPIRMTPRLAVGTMKTSSCTARPASDGTANSARPAPTGTSMRDAASLRRLALVTVSWMGTVSPATARLRGTSMPMR